METVDLSTPQSLRVALRFTSQGGTKYYLSARASGDKYVVETKVSEFIFIPFQFSAGVSFASTNTLHNL